MAPPVQNIFRQEAIDFQQSARQWGELSLVQPMSSKLLGWMLVVAILCMAGFLFAAEYTRKETVLGYLTPTAGTAKIFAPQQGSIRAVHVIEGQQVEQGQPLLTVETSQLAGDGIDVNATLLAMLKAQKDLIIQQIAAEEQRTGSERQRLTTMVAGLDAQVQHLQARIANQMELIRLAHSDVDAASKLEGQGLISAIETRRRRAALLEQFQALDTLYQQLAAQDNQLVEARATLQQLPIVMEQKVQGLRNELSIVRQRIAEIDARQAYVIRAPIAGRVSALQATVGQTVDLHRLQLEIIPLDGVLQAEMFVPTRAIGFVQPGQPVRIMYEAFPYQNFGTYRGRITNVSQTILTPSDVAGPLALKEPAYRITVALERSAIMAYGKKIPLQSDMLLRADIIVETRSLMRWLLDPLLSVRT